MSSCLAAAAAAAAAAAVAVVAVVVVAAAVVAAAAVAVGVVLVDAARVGVVVHDATWWLQRQRREARVRKGTGEKQGGGVSESVSEWGAWVERKTHKKAKQKHKRPTKQKKKKKGIEQRTLGKEFCLSKQKQG